MPATLRFMLASRRSELLGLEDLARTCELVTRISQLVHALQKERGYSNIYLSGNAAHQRQQLDMLSLEAEALEREVRLDLDRIDLDAVSTAEKTRLFTRIAYALHSLDELPALRRRIREHAISMQDATATLVRLIGGLLAVVIGVSLMIARRTASVVVKKPSFWLLALGAASSSVCGYGVAGWLPLFFMRSFDLTLKQTSVYYAGIALIGGLLGIWLGGTIADKLSKKGKGAYPLTPAVAFLISAPCFILAMNSPWLIGLVLPGGGSHVQQLTLAFFIFLLPTGLNLAWLGPITAAVQHLVPAAMRSTASALFLLINNLLGIAVGFYYFGWMSDLLRPTFGEESLRWAIYTGMGFYLLSSALLFGASRTLKKDWVD